MTVAMLLMPCRSTLTVAIAAFVLFGCSSGDDDANAPPATESSLPPSSTATPTTPLTTPPPTTVPPVCTDTVRAGDSLTAISDRADLTLEQLELENGFDASATIHPGQEVDICVGNEIDDVTGASRLAPPPAAVTRQQTELNDLFSNYSMLPLVVDGDSGNYTRQAACAARMGLGLPVHNGHLAAGSEEEAAIFAATELSIPAGAPIEADKWILVDQTCQVIFTGEGNDGVVDVFPTSTGQEGFPTHNVRAFAFRFDPAIDNDGWHDSSSFPTEVDNPVNGNMYKPLYFNNGQAIHGAEFIPPEPRSKGCARMFPLHQDMILDWLGLSDLTEATWNVDEIGVTVMVRGHYQDRTQG